jgi:hypothetical protein
LQIAAKDYTQKYDKFWAFNVKLATFFPINVSGKATSKNLIQETADKNKYRVFYEFTLKTDRNKNVFYVPLHCLFIT